MAVSHFFLSSKIPRPDGRHAVVPVAKGGGSVAEKRYKTQNSRQQKSREQRAEIRKAATALMQPVRSLSNEELQIVQDFRESLRCPEYCSYPDEYVRLIRSSGSRLYILQNPEKDSYWAELARDPSNLVIQVLDQTSQKWAGVIVFDQDTATGQFISYNREFREFDAVRYAETENWTEIQYLRSDRLTGIVYIRKAK